MHCVHLYYYIRVRFLSPPSLVLAACTHTRARGRVYRSRTPNAHTHTLALFLLSSLSPSRGFSKATYTPTRCSCSIHT